MSADIVLLGASSFSGSAFAYAARSGGFEVMELRRPDYDLAVNPGEIAEVIAREDPRFVVNYAALNMVAESWAGYPDYYRTNVIGVAAVAGGLQHAGWCGRWMQISTPEVYGDVDGEIVEGRRFNPSTPYAVSRAACDMHLRALRDTFGFNVVFTRSTNVYGPEQQIYRVIPKTVLSILRGSQIGLHGGGTSARSFIHIGDVSEGVIRVMLLPSARGDYHMATKRLMTIRELVEKICTLMQVDPRAVIKDYTERPGKDYMYLLNDDKIRHETGWRDTIELEVGLATTVRWFKANAARYEGQSLEYVHKP